MRYKLEDMRCGFRMDCEIKDNIFLQPQTPKGALNDWTTKRVLNTLIAPLGVWDAFIPYFLPQI